MPEPTQAEWRCECRSDCCRVVVGTGRRKIVLARLAPRQIPESETVANAHVMAAARETLRGCEEARRFLKYYPEMRDLAALLDCAIAKAKGAP